MEGWFQHTGKPELSAALAEVCDRFEKSFEQAFRNKTPKQPETQAEVELLRRRAAKAEELEQRNKALKEELLKLKQVEHPSKNSVTKGCSHVRSHILPSGDTRSPLTPLAVNEASNLRRSIESIGPDIGSLDHDDLVAEYGALDMKYQKIRGQFLDLVEANTKLRNNLREKTKAYHDWFEHAQALEKQLEARNKKIQKLKGAQVAATSGKLHTTASFSSGATSAGEHELGQHATANAPIAVEEPSLPLLPEEMRAANNQDPIKDEPSSDIPIVVSERSVRKRRLDHEELLQTPAATRIKTEGSDPVVTDERRRFLPQENIDFDDAEEIIMTPTRRRQQFFREETAGHAPEQICTAHHVEARPLEHSPREEDLPTPQPIAAARQTAVLVEKDPEVNGLALGRQDIACPRSIRLADEQRVAALPYSPLAPGIASLAEDSDQENTPELKGRSLNKAGRLDALLASAPLDRPAIALSKAGPLRARAHQSVPQLDLPRRRELPFGHMASRSTASAPPCNADTFLASAPTTTDKSKEKPDGQQLKTKTTKGGGPLRDRPKEKLTIYDFKPNPRYTEGRDYAYTDVVRAKDDRAGLQGCVKEACCGPVWRAHAISSRKSTEPLEFQTLLETWLGDEAWKLTSMSPDEKETMWLKAKTQELANRHGKQHREQFHPMGSPPGLWRTDFPTTQESMLDKEEAEQREKEMVEDRWREAMQPHHTGRYLFRDEC